MKFSALEKLLSSGSLTETDLRDQNVTPGDFIKMREGTRQYAASPSDVPAHTGDRTFKYVFVQEVATGWAKDVPLANGWNLNEFRDRHSPIILSHDYGLAPVGRGGVVKRNVMYEGVASMIGHVTFAGREISETADLTYNMVAAGLLNCGSAGFDVMDMREPTPDEVKFHGLGMYSAILAKNNLTEYSICSIGLQSKAGVIYSDKGEDAFAKMVREFDYGKDAVQEIRETILCAPSEKSFHLGSALKMQKFLEDAPEHGLTFSDVAESLDTLTGSTRSATEAVESLKVEFAKISDRLDSLETPAPEVAPEPKADDSLENFLSELEGESTL